MILRFVLAALAVLSVLPAHAEPLPASIAQLIAGPGRYAMKQVRLHGQIDSCQGFDCNVCPEDMTTSSFDAGKCLSLDFDGFAPQDASDPTMIARARVGTAMEAAFRYATVTLDALYNPSCRTHDRYDASGATKPGDRGIVVCTDRAPVLLKARVVQVLSRRSVLDGLVTQKVWTLTDPPAAEADAMIAVARVARASAPNDVMRAFLHPVRSDVDAKTGIAARGLVCVCRRNDCEGRWPTIYAIGFAAAANPFDCRDVIEHDGRWTLAW